ncbi:hypothetical protein [Marinobacter sp. VGCF2001]|uniref:hypothetical protein n=1 Tax=Marinobacter sp. VGCF2001 TaxID=3417189 RepID=UPI003CEB3027
MAFFSDLRRRKDRWWRYGILKQAYQQAQQSEVVSGPQLSIAFKRFGYKAPPAELLAVWQRLTDVGAMRCGTLSGQSVTSIDRAISDLSTTAISPIAWLDLYRLGLGIGLFLPANRFREKAIAAMLICSQQARASLAELTAGCYAAIETGDYQRANDLLKRMKSKGLSQSRFDQGCWLLQLFSAGPSPWDRHRNVDDTALDAGFREELQGKKLALVGPVATNAMNGSEIDANDLVIKFGYRGGDTGRDPATQGERVDISYYNNKQAQQLSRMPYIGVLASLRWAVFNNHKGRSFFPKELDSVRQLASLQWLMPDTHLNAGPNAVLDLLRFEPESLKIFNTDMMLSSGRFAGYKAPDEKPIDYTRSFIKTHDPVVQFRTLNGLWLAGHISGDERFEAVMAMGLEQYLLQLQEAYGARKQALI